MPRWPRGLHVQAGVQRAVRGMVQPRVARPGQAEYWRRVAVPLFASASYQLPSSISLLPSGPASGVTARTGPAGTGELWTVDLVQVQAGPQHGSPPLVVQQIQAQQSGTITTPPPPVVAQVWLQAGGVNLHLLGQTTTGGNDGIDIGGVTISPGEQLAVTWYNVQGLLVANPGMSPGQQLTLWFAARGTKTVLTAEG